MGRLASAPELASACLTDGAARHGAEQYVLDEIRHMVYPGDTKLHYAVDGIPASARWDPVAQRDTVLCLVELGADPNAADKNGTPPTPSHRHMLEPQ